MTSTIFNKFAIVIIVIAFFIAGIVIGKSQDTYNTIYNNGVQYGFQEMRIECNNEIDSYGNFTYDVGYQQGSYDTMIDMKHIINQERSDTISIILNQRGKTNETQI